MAIPPIVLVPGTTNHCSNPSVESTITGWGKWGTADIARVTPGASHGSYFLQVTTAAVANGFTWGALDCAVQAGETWSVSLDAKGAGNIYIVATIRDSDGTTVESLTPGDPTPLTGEWERYGWTFTVTNEDAAFLRPQILNTESGATFGIDAIQFEKSPSPTPFTIGTRPAKRLPGYMDLGSTPITMLTPH